MAQQVTKINAIQDRITNLHRDAAGNVLKVVDANGGETAFTYDAESNITSLTDPVGNTTVFELDALNRLRVRRDPLLNETHYEYDEEGNVTQILDRNGQFRQFDYDQLDREAAEYWLAPDGTHIRTILSSYDAVGNLLAQSDPDSSYTWTYDALNRVTSEDNFGTPDLPHVMLTREFDKEGNRTSIFDNSGVRIDSAYSDRNELVSKLWYGGDIDEARVDFAYNERGERIATERFSDLAGLNRVGRSATSYDATGRESVITHRDGLENVIADYDYVYDFANQLTQESHHGETIEYGYDLFGQLTSADRTVFADESYTYDLNGNRISSHLHGSDYVTGPNNQLLSDGEFDYEYDDEGRLTRKTEVSTGNVTEFTYDHRHRTTMITEKTAAGIILNDVRYTYDTLGRRIRSSTNGQVVNHLYAGRNAWADFNAAGTATSRYLFGDAIDENIAKFQVSDGLRWYFADKSGSIIGVSEIAGGLSGSRLFDSFGNQLAATGSSLDRFAFTGREFDSAANAYFYRARMYSSTSGRFLSLDPIGFEGNDTNLYRYVFNAPTSATDPLGNAAFVDKVVTTSLISSLGCAIGLLLNAEVKTPVDVRNKFFETLFTSTALGAIPAALKDAQSVRAAAVLGGSVSAGAATVALPLLAATAGFAKCGGAFS